MTRFSNGKTALDLLYALDGIKDDRQLATINREWQTLANEHKAKVEIVSGPFVTHEIISGTFVPTNTEVGALVPFDVGWCFRDEQVRHRVGQGGRKTAKRGPRA